jgi:hypothetical protein
MTELEHRLGEDPELRQAALAYIRADYMRTHAWAKTWLCTQLDHPDKYDPGSEPPFPQSGCPCGFRKGTE